MDAGPDWSLYRAFLAVLDEGSLSAAARLLGQSQPTLGRQMALLEEQLGLGLFTRSPGGLAPTEAALALRPHVEAMASSAAAVLRARSQADSDAGVVRITASEVIGGMVLPQILAVLSEAHPALEIELLLSNRNEDLLRRDADIAVRMARPTQGALFGRRIGEAEVTLCASPSYIQRRGRPTSIADRQGHTVVGFDHIPDYARRTVAQIPLSRELFNVRSDSDLAQLAMIQAGVGIGGCQRPLAHRLGLEPVLEDALSFPMEMWVVMHEDLKSTRRMRIVFDALVAGLKDYLDETA
jgi:DNA-binding transcriptional LysR family regulator